MFKITWPFGSFRTAVCALCLMFSCFMMDDVHARADSPSFFTSIWDGLFGKRDLEEVKFYDTQDQECSLATLKGHPTIINLWASWCRPCVMELPSFERLAHALEPHNIKIYPILMEKSYGYGRSIFYRFGISKLQLYYDREGKVKSHFSVSSLPVTLFLNAEGKVIYRHVGMLDWFGPKAKELIKKHFDVTLP